MINKGDVVCDGDISIGNDAVVNDNALAGGTVSVGSGTIINGLVQENVHTPQLLLIDEDVSYGCANVTVWYDETCTINPGKYNNIIVKDRGTIILKAGTYNCRRLTLDKEAEVVLDNICGNYTTINVREKLFIGNRVTTEFVSCYDPYSFEIYSDQVCDLHICMESSLNLVITAPHATVEIGPSTMSELNIRI